MDALLQSQIFFFIASIATIILTILAGIALWHISRVAKNAHQASDAIQNELTTIVSHVAGAREHIEDIALSIKDAIIQKTAPHQDTHKRSTKTNKK